MNAPITEEERPWTDEELRAAEERCERATPGPWLGDEDIAYDIVDSHGAAIADVWSDADDIIFVAAARTDLPRALREIRALRAALTTERARREDAEMRLAELRAELRGRG